MPEAARRAEAYLAAHRRELRAELAAVDYDAPRDDPWAALPEAERNAMDNAPVRRLSVDPDGRYYSQRRRGRGEWSKPTPIDTSRRAFARVPRRGVVAAAAPGRRPAARRESQPGSRTTCRAASRGSGGRGDGDGGRSGDSDGSGGADGNDPPGGEPLPEEGGDDELSAWEIQRAAAAVAAQHPCRLTPGMFDDAVEEFVYGLSFDAKGGAKSRIFLALPWPLRASFWSELGDQLLRAAQTSTRARRALGCDFEEEGAA